MDTSAGDNRSSRRTSDSFPGAAAVLIVFAVFAAWSCGPRIAPDSKRRSVDGHFAHAIAGQIPRHGSVYSNKEIDVMRAKLAQYSSNVVAKQSIAEALSRLGKYDDALAELAELETLRPGRFETYFEQARALDGKGDLQGALAASQVALKQRASGHDEMGDYFERMFRWRLARSNGDAPHENFLGIAYDSGPKAAAESPELNQQQLVGLLESFPEFADGHLVLGDWLASQSNDQLAARAYLRALDLTKTESDKQRISRRLTTLESKWQAKAEADSAFLFDPNYRARITAEFKQAEEWRVKYELTEQELVRALPEPPALAPDDAGETEKVEALEARTRALAELTLPDADRVLQEMKLRGIEGPAYYHTGLLQTRPSRWRFITSGSPILWAGAGIAALVVFFLYRRVARERWRRRYKL